MKPYKNVYSAEEYKQLQELNEAALEQNKILKRQIDELQNEKRRLQQEVDDAMNVHKVELPREVAEAIEDLRNADLSGFGIMHFIDHISEVKNHRWHGPLRVLRKFTFLDTNQYTAGCELLMNALVNGYTIEQTPSEKLHTKVEELIFNWIGCLDVDEEEVHRLADRIVERAEEILS